MGNRKGTVADIWVDPKNNISSLDVKWDDGGYSEHIDFYSVKKLRPPGSRPPPKRKIDTYIKRNQRV